MRLLGSDPTVDATNEAIKRHREYLAKSEPAPEFPAGLDRMNLWKFCLFTAVGSGIWVTVLALIGYWVGTDLEVVKPYAMKILLYMAPALVLLVAGYVWWHMRIRRREESASAEDGGRP